jgi:structural maintenance of chromosome 3 (chondroitin sulfate proteoglycan 6)
MAIAPDANRLQLLREVAGTKVYDEKKQESETILAETGKQNEFCLIRFSYFFFLEERRKKIADLLKAIEERLLSLETEKEELKQYQKWDRSKRGLECAICTSECEDAKKRIDEVRTRSIMYYINSFYLHLDRRKNEWCNTKSRTIRK